jgi:hypothetical protein
MTVWGEPVTCCDGYYSAGMAQGTPIAQDGGIRGRGERGAQGPGWPVRRRISRSADDLTSRMLTPLAPGNRHEFRYEASMDGDGQPGRR